MNGSDATEPSRRTAPDEDSTLSIEPDEKRIPGPTEGFGTQVAAAQPVAETELWRGRTHWKHYAGRLLLWVAANVLAASCVGWIASKVDSFAAVHAFWTIVGLVIVSGTLIVGRVLFTILSQRYRLTSERLFIERGILGRTIDQTELIRVDDVRIHKSFIDRVFGLGSVTVVTTDATDRETRIEGIPDPEKVAESIRTRTRAMRQKALFVENL